MRYSLLAFVSTIAVAVVACSGSSLPEQIPQSSSEALTRSDGAVLVYAPTVSSDSAQNPSFLNSSTVLFTIFHSGYNNGDAGLYRIGMNGTGLVKIYDPGGQDIVNQPGSDYNPLTNRITFASDVVLADNVWTSNPDGTGLKQVTNIQSAEEPSFSPDGTRIVFEYAPSGNHRIARVDADGTGLVYLTSGGDDHEPNWSPDGKRIVFQRTTSSGDDKLMTMNPDGTGLIDLGVLGSDASWSPDSKWIVFSSGMQSAQDTVMIAHPDGTNIIRVCHSTVYDGAPSWSPDGKWIAFESGGDGNTPTQIWKIASPVVVGSVSDAGVSDSGVSDSGVQDSGLVDSGPVDSGNDSGVDSGVDAGCKQVCTCTCQ